MKHTPWIIIVILILALVLQRECIRPDTVHTYTKDTITIRDTVLKAYPVIFVDTNFITIYDSTIIIQHVDTSEIIRDYLAHRHGLETLVDDSNTFVSIEYHVHRNRLISVKPYIINRKPTSIITTFLPEPVSYNKYFAGIAIGRSPTSFGIGASLALLNKKDHLYNLSYDFINKDVYFTLYFNIR